MRLLAAFLVVIVASPLVGASWFQPGYDAARTGAVPDVGPEHGDVAFVARLPGSIRGAIAIDDGWAYVSTAAKGWTNGTEQPAVWRIGLDNATVEHLFDLPEGPAVRDHFLVDGERAYLSDGRDLIAWELASGEEAWRWQIPVAGRGHHAYCSYPTLASEGMYVACWPDIQRDPSTAPADPVASSDSTPWMVLAKMDPADGEVEWVITPPVEQEALPEEDDPDRVPGYGAFPIYATIAAGAGHVYLYTFLGFTMSTGPTEVGNGVQAEYVLWAFEQVDGGFTWKRSGEQRTGVQVAGVTPTSELEPPASMYVGSVPLVGPEALYVRFRTFQALNLATGDTIWQADVGQADAREIMGNYNLGLRDGVLIATSTQTAYRFDPDTGELAWQHRLHPGSTMTYAATPAVLDDKRAYLSLLDCQVSGASAQRGFQALDLGTGEAVWERTTTEPQPPRPCWGLADPAHADGVIVHGHWDGRVLVIGQTDASLGAPDLESVAYPGVGESVTVDLSGTRPGVDGAATRFMADWGDGSVTSWQDEPRLSHRYGSEGQFSARFVVANENQTTTTLTTFNVGMSAPTEPNLLERAFARENQDLTFGVLGILVALIGGAIAVGKTRRRRGRLQRELAAIEQAYETNQERPMDCEAALAERRAHVQGLALDGALDEGHVALLERRIEELRRQLRLGALDERFQFLPHGMVVRLREMLDDGQISAWEREHVLRALDEEDVLTKKQKGKVRELVDAWFQRDAGTAG